MSINELNPCVQSGYLIAPLMPFILGQANAGSTVSGKLITNTMYQWVRDITDIPGATFETYSPTADDIGHLLRVRMHFTDFDNNFHTVISKPIGPIQSVVSFVNAGPFATNTNNSSVSVTLPTSLSKGNFLLVWFALAGAQNANPVPGWTFLNTNPLSDYVLAYRFVDGSETATYNFGFSGNAGIVGLALQFSGVSVFTPIGVHTTMTGSGTTASNTGITTGSNLSLVLGVIQANSNQVIPPPAGWTPAAGTANNVSSPYAASSRVVTKIVAPAGASGPLSVPISSTSWRVSLYELIAAS